MPFQTRTLLAAATLLTTTLASDPQALKDCLTKSAVPFVEAGSPDYANETAIYNARVQYQPAAIAIPQTTEHVSSALQCASSSQVKTSSKSGGHSFTGYSLGGEDGHFTISLENFQDVILGPAGYDSSIAKIGAGLRLGNMATSLYNQGKVGLPHGTCPGVGIGGHATHGGYGYNSRAWGLSLDAIVAMDAVLPNGTSVLVTPSQHKDLWYALRGAAESFAVITNFYMQTFPVPDELVYFAYSFGDNFFSSHSADEATAMFSHLQSFALNSPAMDSRLSLGTYFDPQSWSTSGMFHGSLSEFNTSIAPALLSGLPSPSNTSKVQAVSWLESLTILAGSDPVLEPLGAGYNLHDDFYAKSVTAPQASPLTADALHAFFTYIIERGTKTAHGWYSIVDLYGGRDSVINTVSASASAYSQRDTLWVFQNYGYADSSNGTYEEPFPDDIRPFITGLNDVIPNTQKDTKFGAYANYIDDGLSPAQAHELYYGASTYERLVEIKEEVDAGDVLGNPQSVGT